MPTSAPPTDVALSRHLLHGLSDSSRLRILMALRGEQHRVTALAELAGLSQPNVSKHLACLWGCGLVAREKRGREMYYWLIDGVEELFAAMDSVIESAGTTIGACPLTAATVSPGCN